MTAGRARAASTLASCSPMDTQGPRFSRTCAVPSGVASCHNDKGPRHSHAESLHRTRTLVPITYTGERYPNGSARNHRASWSFRQLHPSKGTIGMGSGKPRSNMKPVSTALQVVTEGMDLTFGDCAIDRDLPARTVTDPTAVGRTGAIDVAPDGNVWLHVDGQAVAVLDLSDEARQLARCIHRGFRFVGLIVGPGTVRVETER